MILRNRIIACFIFLFLNLIVFGPHFNNALCVDDISFVSPQNPYFLSLKSNLDFFRISNGQHYSPLYYFTNFHLFRSLGENPYAMRWFNFSLHLTGCLLLYMILVRVGLRKPTAFKAILCFSLHPFNAENIYHVSQNYVLLAGIFMSLSFLFFMEMNNNPSVSKLCMGMSAFFYIIALLFWEFALLLPVYVFLALGVRGAAFQKEHRWKMAVLTVISALFLIIWFKTGQHNSGLVQNIQALGISAGQYITGLAHLIVWYFLQFVYPFESVLIYNIPLDAIKPGSYFLYAVSLLIALWFIFFKLKKKDLKFFFCVWFLIGLLPIFLTTFVQNEMGLVMEPHWLYFSSIGMFVLVVLAVEYVAKNSLSVTNIIISAICVYLAMGSFVLGAQWKDNFSYSKYWKSVNPKNRIALNMLADEHMKRGEYQQALIVFQELADRFPRDSYQFHNMMASIYDQTHQIDLAKKHLYLSLENYPENPETYNILGSIEKNSGNLIAAKDYFQKGLSFDPRNALIVRNLIQTYMDLKEYEKAQSLLNSFEKQ